MDYSKYTVVQLKDLLRERGLRLSGRKAELIERLTSAPVQVAPSNAVPECTVFQYYSKSRDVTPGKGAGEKLVPGEDYSELAAIKDWRKKLSNFWVAPFDYRGETWASVEHAYQAMKFWHGNKEYALSFSLSASPDGELAKDSLMAKKAGGRKGMPDGVRMDDSFPSQAASIMEELMEAKFSTHEDLKALLLATGDARLHHFSRGSPPIVQHDLMRVRERLR